MSTPPSSRIANAAIVSLIGAADSFATSTMPAHDATTDTIADYNQPAEMTGTGEIADGTVYCTPSRRSTATAASRVTCGPHASAPTSPVPTFFFIYNGATARHADHRLHVTRSAAPAWLPANAVRLGNDLRVGNRWATRRSQTGTADQRSQRTESSDYRTSSVRHRMPTASGTLSHGRGHWFDPSIAHPAQARSSRAFGALRRPRPRRRPGRSARQSAKSQQRSCARGLPMPQSHACRGRAWSMPSRVP